MEPLPVAYQDFFEKRSFAFVATLLPDGALHVTPTWVGFQREHALVNTVLDNRKDKNVRKDQDITLAIADSENLYQYLSVRGEVVERREEGPATTWIRSPSGTPGKRRTPVRAASSALWSPFIRTMSADKRHHRAVVNTAQVGATLSKNPAARTAVRGHHTR